MVVSYRWCALLLALGALLAAGAGPVAEAAPPKKGKADKFWVFVGTYTDKPSKGIYRLEFDAATGKLSRTPVLVAETEQPSFLAVHPTRRFLYAVNETANFGGKKAGAVSAFALDAKTGKLSFLNRESSGGAHPCHLIVDRQGKHVLAANYTGGSVCVLPLAPDGKLGTATAFVQHEGKSVNKQRQEAPHAHSINLDAANRFAFVADLGLDRVMVYKYDAKAGTLTANDPPAAEVAPGSGPRHFAFHPDGRHAYVINELASTVTAFDYDPAKGALKAIQTISTLPKGYKGDTSTAEVRVHPSGKFVYGSNRGQDSIAVFTVNAKSGKLKHVGNQGETVKVPRNFNIDPTGKFLIVANQGASSLSVFAVAPKTGELTLVESVTGVPNPVCVVFVPRPAVAKE